ncbi:MAG: cytidylate kinase-like family protein [Clostridia bacterium]|nr:cytidylate kinase-like family protein [Clostridia bacterium]MBP3582711.1 cytidylate kinase-like family protein [Clostridia bacterium]MBQ8583713.1 cytidylate kinase-like family protein [Clostridia bacterium]
MSKKVIITIARQFGSGGREIGERVAAALDIPIVDKELIKDAAERGNLHEDVIKKADESAANSLLYTLAMGSNILGTTMHFGYKMPLNDKLFILQSEAIKEYASKGSCVIIGRCADYVLRDEENILRLFIYGDLDHRQARVAERHPELKSNQIIDVINKTDKRRSSYYNFYTGNKWGKYDNYDMAINSSTLGIDGTANLIVAMVKELVKD